MSCSAWKSCSVSTLDKKYAMARSSRNQTLQIIDSVCSIIRACLSCNFLPAPIITPDSLSLLSPPLQRFVCQVNSWEQPENACLVSISFTDLGNTPVSSLFPIAIRLTSLDRQRPGLIIAFLCPWLLCALIWQRGIQDTGAPRGRQVYIRVARIGSRRRTGATQKEEESLHTVPSSSVATQSMFIGLIRSSLIGIG